jgi:hypothetical protein
MAVTLLLAVLSPLTVRAQYALSFDSYDLGGTSSSDVWSNLTSQANPGVTSGSPSTNPWLKNIASQSGGGDAELSKVDGLAYPAGSSIYFLSFTNVTNTYGGTLMVQDSTPVTGVQTVVFQISIGEANTYDFLDHELPRLTLTLNGGDTLTLAAGYTSLFDQYDNGTVSMPSGDETVWINSYALQWDLSNLDLSSLLPDYTGNGDIESLSINIIAVQHAQLYGLQLDQSSAAYSASLLPIAVPEPSSCALLGFGALLLAGLFRKITIYAKS